MNDLPLELAIAIRSAVLPHLGKPSMRGAEGVAIGGDPTFGIDHIAEDAANEILEAAAGDGLAWYTEDRGLVIRGNPTRLLIVDPIDGTRPAGAGLEAGTVSIACAPFDRDARLGDVDDGIVLEIRTGTLYRAKRGKGVRIIREGATVQPSLSPQKSIEGAFWCYGLRGRPVDPSATMLEELLDSSGVRGGTFDLGSACFGMTGVVAGRFDAYVDHGQRMIEDVPETRPMFEALADGAILNNNPYDVAASTLICQEAGCVVTSASGGPVDDMPMVGSGSDFCVSSLVACTPELHRAILESLDAGVDKLREKVKV